jgi:hypothetical protein
VFLLNLKPVPGIIPDSRANHRPILSLFLFLPQDDSYRPLWRA